MKKTMLALTAFALLASPALRAMDDWERRVNIHPDTVIRGVSIPSAFKGLDGKSQPAGLYDVKLHKGTQGILIGLLRNGKTVGEFPGKFVPAAGGAGVPPPDPDKARMGDGSVKPGQAQMQDFHFDASSRVSMAHGSGGGEGKISCSNNLHPGGANLGSISFLLPAVQVQGK
jgi:hypothetical protein